MSDTLDKQAEAKLYWTVMLDARSQARVVGSVGHFDVATTDELEVMLMWTDWPLLRQRVQNDLAEHEVNTAKSKVNIAP